MNGQRAETWADALERARAELEIALKKDADWRALRRARSRAGREARERALARNPVYRAWSQLSRAIEEMRAGTALPGAPEEAAVRQAADGDGGAIRARAEQTARRRRVGLREVLERVRSEAALDLEAPPAPVACDAGAPADAVDNRARTQRIALPDAEEATVSFVVREPVEPAPADAEPPAHAARQPPLPGAPAAAPDAAGRAAAAGDAEARDVGGAEDEAEAEVVIVPRSH